MNSLIMMIGIPGSGKSTYARHLMNHLDNVVIHSSDSIRKELSGSEQETTINKEVFSLLHRRMMIDLQHGKDVIYDATNLDVRNRRNIIRLVRSQLKGVEIIAMVMDSDMEECKAFNLKRERVVPDHILNKMQKDYTVPSLDEGFDRIVLVKQNRVNGEEHNSLNTVFYRSTMADEIEYTGVFFDRQSIYEIIDSLKIGERLSRTVEHPHVTFAYGKQFVCNEFFGQEAVFDIVGYANDGLNEGFKVELVGGTPFINRGYKGISIPHITLSTSEFGKAVNTRYLDFKTISPIRLSGEYGGVTYSGELIKEWEVK